MHVYNCCSFIISLITVPRAVTAVLMARVQTHFYSTCPFSISLPSLSSSPATCLPHGSNPGLLAEPVEIQPGDCQPVYVPSYDPYKVDHISIDAELLHLDNSLPQCHMTVHEVPGCVDPALLNIQIKDRYAVSRCVTRNFIAYTQVWVNLACAAELQQAGPATSSGTQTVGVSSSFQPPNRHRSLTPGSKTGVLQS